MEEGTRGRLRGAAASTTMSTGSSEGGGGGGGWPLGLQPLHVMSRLAAAHAGSREQFFNLLQYNRRNHHGPGLATSPFFLSTPSISSLSSSDLDTESTESFFPERSTTLGSLIGIHHPRAARRSLAHQLQERLDRVDRSSALDRNLKHHLNTSTQRLHACWCAVFTLLIRCASSHCRSHASHHSLSHSLAHLLELERQAANTPELDPAILQCESLGNGIDGVCSHHLSNLNTLFDDDGIRPPHPSGAPSRVSLHQLSPSPTNFSYLSTDWNASVTIERRRKHYHLQRNSSSNNSLCPRFWKIG